MKARILKIGKYFVDVSEMSHAREIRAKRKWEIVFNQNKKVRTVSYYDTKASEIGSYLLNQDFFILKRTYSFGDAVKEWVKRRVVYNSRFLRKLENQQYQEFENYLYQTITGKTITELEEEKKESEKKNDIMTIGLEALRIVEAQGMSLEACMESFQTWLNIQDTQENT